MQISNSVKKIQDFLIERRETFIVSGAVLLVAILFNLFLLGPRNRMTARDQAQIDGLKRQIARVLPSDPQAAHVEHTILERQEELKELESSLPQQERISEILKTLSNRAQLLGVSVNSIRPEPIRPYPNEEAPLRIEGQACLALPITMQIEAPYRVLGKYLESLQDDFPSVLTIDDLDIRRDERKTPLLRIRLLITSYLFEKR